MVGTGEIQFLIRGFKHARTHLFAEEKHGQGLHLVVQTVAERKGSRGRKLPAQRCPGLHGSGIVDAQQLTV